MDLEPSSLRHKLRATVCCCFGSPAPGGCGGLAYRARWRRRFAAEFRYDPLGYALNFDEGGEDEDDGEASSEAVRRRSFSSRLPQPSPPPRPAVAI